MPRQDVIAEGTNTAVVTRSFGRHGQSEWMASLKRVARAQAILWQETPMAMRLAILAQVDLENKEPKA